MADCSDGGQGTPPVLPDHLNLDSLMASHQMKEDDDEEEIPGEETGASLLGDILEMEGTEADLKEEDASLMEALAECEGKEEEEEAEYESEDDEGDDEEEDSDDEEDEEDDDAEESEEENGGEEFDQSKGTEESIDFGEMPDFTSMMEADGSSLEGTVAGDIGLKALQESELMETDSNPVRLDPESSCEKGGPVKKLSRKRKKKVLAKEKGKRLTKRLKREKRKKKKVKKEGEESKVDSSTLKASERRRNIRKILGEKDLEQETLDAQKEELERQQRLMEQKKQALSSLAMASSKPPPVSSSAGTTATTSTSSSKEQDSQLKSLLQSAEEEADKQEKKQAEKQEKKQTDSGVMTEIKKEPQVKQEKVDVIELSSDSEDESNEDDCVMVPSTEEEEDEEVEAEDLNDGGAHINDEYNQRDDQGRVLVNVGHTSEDPDIFLSPQMAKVIKPHQIGGVRFLYDNLVESLPRFNTSQGFGCILAHSMGLGKTIQVIAFIDIFLRHTSAKRVLCIVPINTLQNWIAEFNMWAPTKEKPPPPTPPPPPKARDSEKKARDSEKRSSDKRSRDRSKKDKDSNKDPKQGPKDMRGPILSSGMGPMGPGMGHMGGPGMGHMGGPGMGHGMGHGMNSMVGPGMGPVGGMMGQPGGYMNPMSGMGPMGGPGPMGRPMGQMGGMDPMGNHNMCQMGGHGMGPMGGPGMGGPGMGGPGMGYMGHMGGMGMHNMNYMGGGSGPFMGSMGMPWMSSTMGQNQYGHMHGSPYGPPRPNPMGMGSMGPPGMGHGHMPPPPPTSMNQTPGSDTSMSLMGTSGAESMNPQQPGSAASSENLGGASAGNPVASMPSMNSIGGASGNTMNAGNPMGTPPPPPSSMNSFGNSMNMGNTMSAENPMGTPPPGNQAMPMGSNAMNAPSGRNMMGPMSMDSMRPGSGSGNPMGPGAVSGNPMNIGAGHPMGPGFGNTMGSGHGNYMPPGFGNPMNSSVNPMNSLSAMTPPVGNPLGALSSLNSPKNPMEGSVSSNMSSPMHPMNALSSSTTSASSLSSSPASSLSSFSTSNTTSCSSALQSNMPQTSMASDSGCDKSAAPPSSSSGDAFSTSTVDSRATPMGHSGESETPKDGQKAESEVKGEGSADVKSDSKDETGTGKEGEEENKGEKPEEKKTGKVGADGILREEGDTLELRYRNFKVFLLSENLKTTAQRARIIGDWKETGGVLLMGYEMYRLLASRRSYTPKNKKKKKKPEEGKEGDVIDVDEEDKNKSLMTDMYGALVNPGPDLVICDEGHRIKNNHASISQSLKQIRTKRRVVLTGYPLQNNLMEYWCMVDFVRPNFLGNKTEFSNMFERPIMNGQCQDSTSEDIKIMKHRAYVLHNLLEGFVQRRGHTVLQRALPCKHEYVFLVRMSPIQRKLYRRYIDSLEKSTSLAQANNNPLRAFSVGCKIWNHPDILHKSVVLKKPVIEENDLDIESSEVNSSKKKLKKSDSTSSLASTASMSSIASTKSSATVASNVSHAAGLPDSVSSSNLASDAAASNGAIPSLPSADGVNASVPESDACAAGIATGSVNGDISSEVGVNSAMSPAGKTGGNSVSFSLDTGTSFCSGADSSTGIASSTGLDTDTGLGVSSDASNSNSISTLINSGMSTNTETSTVVSSSTDTNTSVSAGTETTGVSTGTDTSTGVSTGTDASVGVSTGTGTTETSVGTGTGDNECGTPLLDKKEDEHAWVGDAFDDYEAGLLEHGPKMVLLNAVIEEGLKIGDKILVFSQSLSTLDIIEEFMSKQKVPRPDMDENWSKNRSYFRLDGSTSSMERERLITEFNRPTNTTSWMFLLSTRAGCLGINLIGANRVVVLDASWNPCHDCQAVCRVFRFGQSKQCYVYRLVTENTLERNIYDRQITKQGMSDRVIDEMNPDNHFSRGQMENLLKNEDKDFPYLDFSACEESYDDPVMVTVLKKQGQWITKEPFTHESLLIDRKELHMSKKEKLQAKEGYARDKRMNITYSRPSYAAYYPGSTSSPSHVIRLLEPFTHESLLIDRKELRMSKKEKLQAKEGYARDKRMNITYSRPSYAAYYPGGGSQMYIRRGPVSRPIASVRPMISTSISRPTVQVVKPGVTVHQVITTTDILLPGTNTATSSGTSEPAGKIASGQKILVIKTPKGVYIRTNDGKMFAVRSKVAGTDDASTGTNTTESSVAGASTTTTTTTTTVSSGTRVAINAPPPRIFFKTPDGKLTEKNPNDVKGGASLLANLYSQTSSANAVFKRNNKGQIMRVLPAAPIRTLSRPRPTIVASSAATSKAAKPPVEVIVYPRSKVISTGRACKVLDKPGEPSGKSASTLVVQPQKESMTASVTASTTTLKRIEPAPAKAITSMSPPVSNNLPKQTKDLQVMKLLASDDEDRKVGKSVNMASLLAAEKDSNSAMKIALNSSKEANDSAESGNASSDKVSDASGERMADSVQTSPAATESSKAGPQERTDFAAPAPPQPITSQPSNVPGQESSSQGSSLASSASQPPETPLPQSMIQSPSQLTSVSQPSSQPMEANNQQAFSMNQPGYSMNSQQPYSNQPLQQQQPFGGQAAAQPVNGAPAFASMSSSQQSYGGQSTQQPFGQQPQSFPNQPANPVFSHQAPQPMFSGQQSHYSNQPGSQSQPPHFNSQPSSQTPHFNNQPASQPPHFGNMPNNQSQNFNSPSSNQTQNFNNPSSGQVQNFNNSSSSQGQNFSNPSTSQTQTFSNPSGSQAQNFNNPSSTQVQNFNNQPSSQTPNFSSPPSSQPQNFNNPPNNQTQNFNNLSSNQTQNFNNLSSNQTQNYNNLSSNQTQNFSGSPSSQPPNFNKPASNQTQNFNPTPSNQTQNFNSLSSSQAQSFSSRAPFNNQPSQASFNTPSALPPYSNQSAFGNQPQQSPVQSQHASMSSTQQQQSQPGPQQPPAPLTQQPQQQPPAAAADIQVSQPQYSHGRSDYMQAGHMRPTPPFHQPWGQPQSSYMPSQSFPDYNPYHQPQQQQPPSQPAPQQAQSHPPTQTPAPAPTQGSMMGGHGPQQQQQQQPMTSFPHSQLQASGASTSASPMTSPFGFGPSPSHGQGAAESQSQGQGQNESASATARPSAFRPPLGGTEKAKALEMKSTPTPPVERESQRTTPQPTPPSHTPAAQPAAPTQPAQSLPPVQPQAAQPPPQQQQPLPAAPSQPLPPSQPIAHPTPQHPEGRYPDNWWSSPGMGGGSHGGHQGMSAAATLPSSSASPASYQSAHSAFTPTNPSYFHPGLSPFGMGPPPQSNFPMMGQGLGMPGSYPFLPSFHPGFMSSPFSHQGLGGAGSGFSSGAGGGPGGYGFGGQGSESMGSFRALLDETPDRGTLPPQPAGGSTAMGSTSSSLVPEAGSSGMGLSTSNNPTSAVDSGPSSSGASLGAGVGGLGIGGGSMNGLAHAPSMSMPSSTSSMYGNSAMSLGYPGLFPMLNPMPNPMFMPMMPSPMMGQHYPMQPSHAPQTPGPLSAMGHMASMGSHMPAPAPGLPPPS